jgi:hypothetical protein
MLRAPNRVTSVTGKLATSPASIHSSPAQNNYSFSAWPPDALMETFLKGMQKAFFFQKWNSLQ